MAPLVTLVSVSLVVRLVGWAGIHYLDSWTVAIAVGLAAMFVLTGIAHFAPPLRADLIAIVPPQLPAPAALVAITGVFELLGALGLLIPVTRFAAALCLLVLMLAMFPANIYASRMPDPPKSMTTQLPLRTAAEIVFLTAAVVVAIGGS
ncbi:MAG TPA: hypothetical protein VME67_15645 [Mycobacterium sp.]|nr:hypothetical protein [Mycobacterium sp.]HTX96162.1 hypothetical protein [Mycobacterium sp.]